MQHKLVRRVKVIKMYGLVFVTVVALVRGSGASLVTCPATAEGNVLVAHQFECSSFFLCDGSGPKPTYLLRCRLGSYFTSAGLSQACADMSEVDCAPHLEVNPVSLGRSSGPLPPIEPPDSYRNYTTYRAHARNCSQFYKLEGWTAPILYECPRDLKFDPVLEICDLPSEVDCRGRECQHVPEPVCPPTNESAVNLPHPSDCGAYYVCDWGEPVLKHCPGDLYFNPELEVCDWPRNVDCNRCPPGEGEYETSDGLKAGVIRT